MIPTIRKIDELGRVVLPTEIRNALRLTKASAVTIIIENTSIVITPAVSTCKLCGSQIENNSIIHLCKPCIQHIKNS